MTPFTNAMSLIDGDQRKVGAADQSAEAFAGRAFWRDIEQIELSSPKPLDGSLAIAVGGRERGGSKPNGFGTANLVVHQRDER